MVYKTFIRKKSRFTGTLCIDVVNISPLNEHANDDNNSGPY